MPEPVICPICHRQCAAAAGLASHMRAMHRDEWRREQEAEATRRPSSPASMPPPSPSRNGNGLVWEAPPKGKHGGGRRKLVEIFGDVVPELKAHAGDWLRFRDYEARNSASSQALLLRKAFPDLEIVGCALDSGGSAVFARFVAPSEA